MWKYFSYDTDPKLSCSCCGGMGMEDSFMHKLDILREYYGKPITISSGFRCASHNSSVSRTGATGPHTTGRAVDVAVYGADAFALLAAIHKSPAMFTGVGLKQKGKHNTRFIHLDDLLDNQTKGPRPWVWTY